MRTIPKNDAEKEVTEFVINNFKGSGLIRLNLRTQWKALNTYNYAVAGQLDWKEEITSELKSISKVQSMLYSLIGEEAVRRVDLKKLLIRHELVASVRVADMKIREWLFIEELFEWSNDERNGFVALIPKPTDYKINN